MSNARRSAPNLAVCCGGLAAVIALAAGVALGRHSVDLPPPQTPPVPVEPAGVQAHRVFVCDQIALAFFSYDDWQDTMARATGETIEPLPHDVLLVPRGRTGKVLVQRGGRSGASFVQIGDERLWCTTGQLCAY